MIKETDYLRDMNPPHATNINYQLSEMHVPTFILSALFNFVSDEIIRYQMKVEDPSGTFDNQLLAFSAQDYPNGKIEQFYGLYSMEPSDPDFIEVTFLKDTEEPEYF